MAENSAIEWTGRQLGAMKSAATKTGLSLEAYLAKQAGGESWCFRCRSWKPTEVFSIDVSRPRGRAASCKACTSTASTASRYGTTSAELARMASNQNGRCLICSRKRRLVVDHDHHTGAIRGLLCNPCNVGVGQFRDDPVLLRAAASYLERTDG